MTAAVSSPLRRRHTSGDVEMARVDKLKPDAGVGRDRDDAYLLDTIIDVHTSAGDTYGVRRVNAEARPSAGGYGSGGQQQR
jgi:hypothetical protein